MRYSLVLLTTEKEKANSLLEFLGWGPDNFSVTLSNGYFGLHGWAELEFIETLNSEMAPTGFSLVDFTSIKSNLVVSYNLDATDHFSSVLTDNNLTWTE